MHINRYKFDERICFRNEYGFLVASFGALVMPLRGAWGACRPWQSPLGEEDIEPSRVSSQLGSIHEESQRHSTEMDDI